MFDVGFVNSSGVAQGSNTYQPFGKSTHSGTAFSAFQFTGRENDGTGLDYYRARYYSPLYQRFIAQDSLDFRGGGPNLYAYTLDNPLSFVDPTGTDLLTCISVFALGGAIAFAAPVIIFAPELSVPIVLGALGRGALAGGIIGIIGCADTPMASPSSPPDNPRNPGCR